MATFVLVHGARGGAYAFRHVHRLLQDRGHDVFTPSLAGIGERRHLTSPLVDLTTHIYDVVNLALYEDVRDVVLLGFSYGVASSPVRSTISPQHPPPRVPGCVRAT